MAPCQGTEPAQNNPKGFPSRAFPKLDAVHAAVVGLIRVLARAAGQDHLEDATVLALVLLEPVAIYARVVQTYV